MNGSKDHKYLRNSILSIIYQNYKNWRIIFCNDGSDVDLENKLLNLTDEYKINEKVNYFKTEKEMGKVFCRYESYKRTNLDEIVILLDSSDWFSINSSLSVLANKYLKDENSLLVYSGHNVYSDKTIKKNVKNYVFSKDIIKNKLYREHYLLNNYYVLSGYSNLFKQIPVDHIYNENYINTSSTLGEFLCLAEISGNNVSTISDYLYILNQEFIDNNIDINVNNEYNNYIRSCQVLNKYYPPIYFISGYGGINKDLLNQTMNLNSIKNYELILMCNDKKNKNLNKIIGSKNKDNKKSKSNNMQDLNYIYHIFELFRNIEKNTNLDHVFIINSNIMIYNDFSYNYDIDIDDISDKDVIFIGYNANSSKKNYKFTEIEENTDNKYLNNDYSFIVNKKFRKLFLNLGIEYFIENNLNLLDSLRILFEDKDSNGLLFFNYYKNLIIPDINDVVILDKFEDIENDIDIQSYSSVY